VEVIVIKKSISKLIEGKDLSMDEAMDVMEIIMDGDATSAQIAAFITALRVKGETPEEIAGMASIMRNKSVSVQVNKPVLDTCGTGGDGANTLNISTATGLLVSSAGVTVAKHGNRAMSGSTGSADVLEAMGANIQLDAKEVELCLEKIGFGFMFAQMFHPSMKYAAAPRKEIGIRTVFNLLGPLTNPAGAEYQLIGVSEKSIGDKLIQALKILGSTKALVVHGLDGLDEVSLANETEVWELNQMKIKNYRVSPEQLGFQPQPSNLLAVKDAEDSASKIIGIFDGDKTVERNSVLANSALALYACGKASNFKEGVSIAADAIDQGLALNHINAYVEYTKSLKRD
tara:strand:+ start:24389 stop:25420 length:1032 start_codon:yes stop_codon:yes gene_type:complete